MKILLHLLPLLMRICKGCDKLAIKILTLLAQLDNSPRIPINTPAKKQEPTTPGQIPVFTFDPSKPPPLPSFNKKLKPGKSLNELLQEDIKAGKSPLGGLIVDPEATAKFIKQLYSPTMLAAQKEFYQLLSVPQKRPTVTYSGTGHVLRDCQLLQSDIQVDA